MPVNLNIVIDFSHLTAWPLINQRFYFTGSDKTLCRQELLDLTPFPDPCLSSAFLASDEASFLSGSEVVVDGGQICQE